MARSWAARAWKQKALRALLTTSDEHRGRELKPAELTVDILTTRQGITLVYVLYGIYILACVFLILVVLLQSGKGGDVAAAFGGAGSQTAFGPRGAQKPLEKATAVAAGLFMLLALIFSLPGVTGPRSVVTN